MRGQQGSVLQAEITILGAGIGGCIAALALQPYYSVLLVDTAAEPAARVGESLAGAAGRILHQLSLLPLLQQGHLRSHGLLSYWGSSQPQLEDRLADPDGAGWQLDRVLFAQQLRQTVQARGVCTLWPARLASSVAPVYQRDDTGHWELQLTDSQQQYQLRTRVVIDATGRHRQFARLLGGKCQQLDQLLSVWLTARVRVQKAISVLSSSSQGWWYSAPLPDAAVVTPLQQAATPSQARLFAWQVPAAQLDKSHAQSAAAFLQAAAQVPGFATLVSQVEAGSCSEPVMVAANSARLTEAAGPGWFAIGDAALSFDPLSAQGMFNAMATAMQLADLLIADGLSTATTAASYQSQLDLIWQHYLQHRQRYYQLAG